MIDVIEQYINSYLYTFSKLYLVDLDAKKVCEANYDNDSVTDCPTAINAFKALVEYANMKSCGK